jgi:hypothetical protein
LYGIRDLLEAATIEPNNVQYESYRMFPRKLTLGALLSGITAMCQRGSMTERRIEKVVMGVGPVAPMGDYLTNRSARGAYDVIRSIFPADRAIGGMFAKLQQVFPRDLQLRMNLIVSQAAGSGVAAVNIIVQAMRTTSTCPAWRLVDRMAPEERPSLQQAMAIVAANPYAGFDLGRNIDPVLRATGYPGYLHTALKILTSLDDRSTVRYYGGKPVTPIATFINRQVDEWIAAEAARHAQEQAAAFDVYDHFDQNILDAIHNNGN